MRFPCWASHGQLLPHGAPVACRKRYDSTTLALIPQFNATAWEERREVVFGKFRWAAGQGGEPCFFSCRWDKKI